MLCLKVSINGRLHSVVGQQEAEAFGVTLSGHPSIDAEMLSLVASGHTCSDEGYPDELCWFMQALHRGDQVLIEAVESDSPDLPTVKRYVEGNRFSEQSDEASSPSLVCSNCGASQFEVTRLVQSDRLNLCQECIESFSVAVNNV